MRIDVLTLFPEMFAPLDSSIIKRARENGILEIHVTDIRDYSKDKHRKCDDMPFGGGDGMVMTPQPIFDAIQAIDPHHEAKRIYLSPKGKVLTQNYAKELAHCDRLLLLCGHYEGVDQRAIDLCIDEEVSIGDFVLTGGELPAMVLIDCVARFVSGVLGSESSAYEESFSDNLLEYPQYTRPQIFMGIAVPEVLVSGHHANIAKWRMEQRTDLTEKLRPDLMEKKDE